jgi:hypothetical protein
MFAFSGSANRDLAERICKYIGVPLAQAAIRRKGRRQYEKENR